MIVSTKPTLMLRERPEPGDRNTRREVHATTDAGKPAMLLAAPYTLYKILVMIRLSPTQ